MERVKAALIAIRADHDRAAQILEAGIAEGGPGFLQALGVFIAAALAGLVIDPDDL